MLQTLRRRRNVQIGSFSYDNTDNGNNGINGRGSGGDGGSGGNDNLGNEGEEPDNLNVKLIYVSFVSVLASTMVTMPAQACEAKEKVQEYLDQMIDFVAPHASTLGISGIMGYVSALAVKTTSRWLAVSAGFVFIFLQMLSYKGFVTMNWEEMERQGKSLLDFNGDGVTDTNDAKVLYKRGLRILSSALPSVSGFYTGFFIGIK
eukprot:CAMPEP_0196589644 /NCGR_PEP_ID=MMETSP1081-20130531/64167_1 /TAXON_ID=36882 /ORGANISM="Pyramimonas amylifera, Strain CCMP720" /LENGTH=203 /DNA_ID=CAMNT_0041912499 /DNA_START=155 /DNA_END=766 /DNA_ORIENTATION=+